MIWFFVRFNEVHLYKICTSLQSKYLARGLRYTYVIHIHAYKQYPPSIVWFKAVVENRDEDLCISTPDDETAVVLNRNVYTEIFHKLVLSQFCSQISTFQKEVKVAERTCVNNFCTKQIVLSTTSPVMRIHVREKTVELILARHENQFIGEYTLLFTSDHSELWRICIMP